MLKEGVPIDQQRIVYSGIQLAEEKLITDYIDTNKFTEVTLHCILRLRGGMYNEVSGRDGAYKPIKNLENEIFEIDIDEED